jgi:hypothetical protein
VLPFWIAPAGGKPARASPLKPAPTLGRLTPRPVRLLLVVGSLDLGGAERHAVDLAVALRCKGYEVTVASFTSGALRGA